MSFSLPAILAAAFCAIVLRLRNGSKIRAFNLAERYRLPVLVMMDECVGHMMERVVIPPAAEIDIYPRRYTTAPLDEYLPYGPNGDLVPEMARTGVGYRFHVTGLTHDEHGYPDMTPSGQARLVRRLADKIRRSEAALKVLEGSKLANELRQSHSYVGCARGPRSGDRPL